MRTDFEVMKSGWLASGLPVSSLFTRIGIASGRVSEAIMGHPQYQSLTVMGAPMVLATNLCAGAPRERSVILADEGTVGDLGKRLTAKPVAQALLKKIKGVQPAAYEVLAVADA